MRKAQVCLDNTLLEEISIDIGLQQGCCMALVLFNLCVNLAFEPWTECMKEEKGVGVDLRLSPKIHSRYEKYLSECQLLVMWQSLPKQDVEPCEPCVNVPQWTGLLVCPQNQVYDRREATDSQWMWMEVTWISSHTLVQSFLPPEIWTLAQA